MAGHAAALLQLFRERGGREVFAHRLADEFGPECGAAGLENAIDSLFPIR
jgi:hypothetical protein